MKGNKKIEAQMKRDIKTIALVMKTKRKPPLLKSRVEIKEEHFGTKDPQLTETFFEREGGKR